MQNKKYLLRLIVLAVAFAGVLGLGIGAKVEAWSCECGSGTPFEPIGSELDVTDTNVCNQECANMGADKYQYIFITYSVTKTPTIPGTVCYCKYVPAIAGGQIVSVGIKASAEDCKAICETKNEIQTEIEKYCYPTKTDCKSMSPESTTSVGCYEATSCMNYTSKDKCPAGTKPCPNDAKCNGNVCAGQGTTSPNPGSSSGSNPGSNPGSGAQTPIEFPNPLSFDTIDGVLTSLLGSLKDFVVILAIIFIVIGGILYMLSAGDPKMVERAKNCWLYSVIGLAIVVAAPTFLKQVQEILGGTLTGGGMAGALSVKEIANNILKFLLSITGIIAIISLVIAGGMYMTAYGEEKQITTAKSIGKWAIVGIIVALGSLTIIQQVSKLITG